MQHYQVIGLLFLKRNLGPEKSWNFNINYVKNIYTDSDIILEFDSSLFYTNFSNKIIPNYNIDPNKIIYKNLTNSSITRGGLSLNSTFSSGLRINFGVTFLDNYIDNIVKERPELTESFWVFGECLTILNPLQLTILEIFWAL